MYSSGTQLTIDIQNIVQFAKSHKVNDFGREVKHDMGITMLNGYSEAIAIARPWHSTSKYHVRTSTITTV